MLPHAGGHVAGQHPVGVPVEIEDVTAITAVSGVGDASSMLAEFNIGRGQMRGPEDVQPPMTWVLKFSDDGSPITVFIVGEIEGFGMKPTEGADFCRSIRSPISPVVDDVHDSLFRIGDVEPPEAGDGEAGAAVDFDFTIVAGGPGVLLTEIGHEELIPPDVTTCVPAAAGDEFFVVGGVEVGA